MAKKSSIEKNNRRRKLAKQYRRPPRAPEGDRHATRPSRWRSASPRRLKLAELPRNSSATRIRNRCEMTGRPRALLPQAQDVSRIALRELGSKGLIPGLVKSSW